MIKSRITITIFGVVYALYTPVQGSNGITICNGQAAR